MLLFILITQFFGGLPDPPIRAEPAGEPGIRQPCFVALTVQTQATGACMWIWQPGLKEPLNWGFSSRRQILKTENN